MWLSPLAVLSKFPQITALAMWLVAPASADVLYDNGPVVTSAATGHEGADESVAEDVSTFDFIRLRASSIVLGDTMSNRFAGTQFAQSAQVSPATSRRI